MPFQSGGPFVGMSCAADDGVDPVAGDEHVALVAPSDAPVLRARGRPTREPRRRRRARRRGRCGSARHRAGRDRPVQDAEQLATMDRVLRPAVARGEPRPRGRRAGRALKNTSAAVGIAVAAESSPSPSSISSRAACGRTLTPTPSSRTSLTASYTSTSVMPASCRLSASAHPPMPPPTITTFTARGCHKLPSWSHRRGNRFAHSERDHRDYDEHDAQDAAEQDMP